MKLDWKAEIDRQSNQSSQGIILRTTRQDSTDVDEAQTGHGCRLPKRSTLDRAENRGQQFAFMPLILASLTSLSVGSCEGRRSRG
jgi:hypothetical protein